MRVSTFGNKEAPQHSSCGAENDDGAGQSRNGRRIGNRETEYPREFCADVRRLLMEFRPCDFNGEAQMVAGRSLAVRSSLQCERPVGRGTKLLIPHQQEKELGRLRQGQLHGYGYRSSSKDGHDHHLPDMKYE